MPPGVLAAQDDGLLALGSLHNADDLAESVQDREARVCLDLPQNFKTLVCG